MIELMYQTAIPASDIHLIPILSVYTKYIHKYCIISIPSIPDHLDGTHGRI